MYDLFENIIKKEVKKITQREYRKDSNAISGLELNFEENALGVLKSDVIVFGERNLSYELSMADGLFLNLLDVLSMHYAKGIYFRYNVEIDETTFNETFGLANKSSKQINRSQFEIAMSIRSMIPNLMVCRKNYVEIKDKEKYTPGLILRTI